MIKPNHDPQEVTRILFQDFPTTAIVIFYIVAFSAIAVFLYGFYIHIRKYGRGQHLSTTWKPILRRLAAMFHEVLSQKSIRRRDKSAGIAHSFLFYGFVLLFIGTSLITVDYDILGPLGLSFWYGSFYLWFQLIMDIAGTALLGGFVYLMYRRGWLAPPKLDYARPDRRPQDPDFARPEYRREDWAFLWILVLIGVTGFLLSAARMIWLHEEPTVWDYRWWKPVAATLAHTGLGAGLERGDGEALRLGLWWTHGVLALAFIAMIPFTKAKHMLVALVSVMGRDPAAMRRLPKADVDAQDIGYSKLTDFSAKHLVNLDACIRCGKCHEACPATETGFPLSPRDMVLSLRELADDELSEHRAEASLQVIGDGLNQVRTETLWSCRSCGACTEICPVGVEHVPMIVEMRRHLVETGELDPILQTTLQSLQKNGNAVGESRRKRPRWTRGLDFQVKDARKEPVDILWFVGDFASFDPRSHKVSQAFARILHGSGVDFGILYEAETTAGNDVRRVGEEGLYQMLVQNNIETLEGCEFNRIVTTDPHSYNTLKNEYGEFGAAFEVEHASSLLQEMLESGQIKVSRQLNYRVTFHDPCHLGRFNRVFDPPREVIKGVGLNLVELERSRDNSFCCGAGGGRIWLPDPPGQDKPSENRVREAAKIDGLDVLVVNCPKCMNMLDDAAKTTGNENNFQVMDIIEMVAEAMEPEGRLTADA